MPVGRNETLVIMKHNFPLLNLSYVLTASAKFLDTLDNIVKGLNKAGFNAKDYKLADPAMIEEARKQELYSQLTVFPATTPETPDDITAYIDTSRIARPEETSIPDATVLQIEQTAIEQNEAFESRLAGMNENGSKISDSLPNELQNLVKKYSIKEIFKEQAGHIKLRSSI